ncbi:MAG: hypothetical protein FWG53_01980 [Clostridiales bacterium]|nr:hypothetical protein [Clostridiales bacterium]
MIPLKLETLLEGRVVEQDRVEYKRGWNPSEDKHKEYWIKPSSVKTIAKGSELSELFSKFNSVPFDDRVNRQAKIEDIRRGYVEDFLVESNSALSAEINKKPIQDMMIALEVANATDVGVDIRNIGLLMFADRPDKFLPGATETGASGNF